MPPIEYGTDRPRILKRRVVRDGGYFERDVLMTVRLTREQAKNPERVVDYWFADHDRCGHDHDCCGCWSWRVWYPVRRTKRREYTFIYAGRANV